MKFSESIVNAVSGGERKKQGPIFLLLLMRADHLQMHYNSVDMPIYIFI